MKEHFESISDPRQTWKVEYNLLEIIVMTICAVISGCEYWEDIVDFCRVKRSVKRDMVYKLSGDMVYTFCVSLVMSQALERGRRPTGKA